MAICKALLKKTKRKQQKTWDMRNCEVVANGT